MMDDKMPPMMANPPPPPYYSHPIRQGRGWKYFALFLLFILVSIMGLNFLLFLAGGSTLHSGSRFQEVMVEDQGSENKIAVIKVEGMITGAMLDGVHDLVTLIRDQLKIAKRDTAVKAVLLKVDSPGGEVMASDEIHNLIQAFQADTGKPVIASMGSLAASGGYYVSAPCRWIVANELTITGSVGVIMQGYNYRGLMDKVGVRPQTYKSGKFKDMLSGSKSENEILPEEKQMVQALIDQTYSRFTNIVVKGRAEAAKANKEKGRALSPEWRQLVDGRVFSGKEAYEHGFVDQVGNFETAVAAARDLARIGSANLVRYEVPFDLLSVMRLLGKTDTGKSVKLDLGLDLPRIWPGRMYFLAPSLWE
jgi:protease-4